MELSRPPTRQRRGHCRSTTLVALLLGLLTLGGCGLPAAESIGATIVVPTRTPTPLPPTATATAAPTATPTIAPTATTAPPPATPAGAGASPTPVGGYRANWPLWLDEQPRPDYNRTYDPAQDEYHVALFPTPANGQEWSFFAPEGQKFQNFTLEVEARAIAGPDALGYGLVFRRQPRQGDLASERYIFEVTPQGRFGLYQVTTDNNRKTLRQLDAPGQQGVVKVAQEPNRLKVTCQGGTITLLINDVEVFRLTNATLTQSGEIGIYASVPAGPAPSEVAFKNLRLTPIR